MRDPTQPMSFSVATKARPKLVLQAIYFGAGRKQAVVNGKLVSEGDEVSQAVITAISSSRVYYRQGAHTGSLSVRPKVSKATQ